MPKRRGCSLRLHLAAEAFPGCRLRGAAGPALGAVALRYALPAWTPETKRAHKVCDIALAAAEAVHVAG